MKRKSLRTTGPETTPSVYKQMLIICFTSIGNPWTSPNKTRLNRSPHLTCGQIHNYSDAGTGGVGALTPPIFGRSVNPIPTREGRLSPPITAAPPPKVVHLPASLIWLYKVAFQYSMYLVCKINFWSYQKLWLWKAKPLDTMISKILWKFDKLIIKATIFFDYILTNNALSFYGSKMILDHQNHFGRVPIVLDGPNLFWSSGPNHFGQVQIIKISPEKFN